MLGLNDLYSSSFASATIDGITTIAGAAYIRPVAKIAPEEVRAEGFHSVADRFEPLTGYLPLESLLGAIISGHGPSLH